jgi:hypothetical protein
LTYVRTSDSPESKFSNEIALLSDKYVPVGTYLEEKVLDCAEFWSEDSGILRKSSKEFAFKKVFTVA